MPTIWSRRCDKAVADYLVAQGIDSARLEVRGYGYDRPLPGRRASDGANRRVREVGDERAQCGRFEPLPGVGKQHDLAGCLGNERIQDRGLAAAAVERLNANPKRLVPPHQLDGVVCRAVRADDEFQLV